MADKSPAGDAQSHLASMRDLFTRLGFDCAIDSIRFKPQGKNREKRGRKRGVGEKQLSVTSINRWQITQNEISELGLTIDIELFQEHLRQSVTRFFGTKSEAETNLNLDGVIDLAVLCIQPSTKNQERGYLHLPREDELPIGCFGFKLKILTCNEGLTILMNNVFGLAYLPTDFLLRAEEWIHTSLGVEGISATTSSRANFTEFLVPVDALVLSAVGAKDSERRQAMDLLSKWRERNTHRVDYRLEFYYEDGSIEITSVLPGERRPIQNITVQALEIRELIRENHPIEKAFLGGQWSLFSDLLTSQAKDDPNVYIQSRSALMLLMASFPTKYKKAMDIVNASTDSIEVLSAKLRISDSRTENLAVLSKMTRYILQYFEFAEHSKAIGLVFSEYLGDLWSDEDLNVAVDCYDRALEMEPDSGRLLRKKKNIYANSKNLKLCIETIDRLIAVEPRKVEISRLLIEKGHCFIEMGRKEDAVDTGILSVSYDRASIKAAFFLAGALKEAGLYAESVQSLDELLSADISALSGKQQAEINTYIGEVWLVHLKSPEIAMNRLRQATILDPDSEPSYRLLATSLEQIGRFDEQLKVLEDYLLLAEKMDDSDAMHWAKSKLNLLYNAGIDGSSMHKMSHLRSWLAKGRLTIGEFEQIAESHNSYDEWLLITASLNKRLNELESNVERGMIFEKLAEGSKEILKDDSLEGHFYRKAWESGFLSENIFRINFQVLAVNEDPVGQARLCEAWIEQDVQSKILVVRDVMDQDIPVSAVLLDRWIVSSLAIDPENIDMLIRRIQHYMKIDNAVAVVKLWTKLEDSGLGLIRRRRTFNYIRDYLVEKNMYDILFGSYLFFIERGDDQIETIREALDLLGEKISKLELGMIVKHSLDCNEIPKLDHQLIAELLESYPFNLKKFHLLNAELSSSGQERLSNIILANNVSSPDETGRLDDEKIEKLIHSLFVPAEQSEWHGVENIKFIVYSPQTRDILIRYLMWWVPKISKMEKLSALHMLFDIMNLSKKPNEEVLIIIDELLSMGDEDIIAERVAAILMNTTSENRLYRIKAIIESSKSYRKVLLEAASDINPREFGESVSSIFQLMVSVGYNHIECFKFYTDAHGYVSSMVLKILDRVVQDYLLSTLTDSDQVFRFWLENEKQFPACQRILEGVFSLEGSNQTSSSIILENLWSLLVEFDDNEVLSKAGMKWVLHQLKNLAENDVVSRIFLAMSPNLLSGPKERVQAYIICKKIGDDARTNFYADQVQAFANSMGEVDQFYSSTSTIDSEAVKEIAAKESGFFIGDDGRDGINIDSSLQPQDDTVVLVMLPVESDRLNIAVGEEVFNSVISEPTELIEDPLIPDMLITEVSPDSTPNSELTTKTTRHQWRNAIAENSVNSADVSKLASEDGLSAIERHVALQAYYLMTGQSQAIASLNSPVWRNRNLMDYKFHLGQRFPDHCVSDALLSPLAVFLKEIYPIVVLNNMEKIALNGLAISLGKTEDQVLSSLKAIEWTDNHFIEAGFRHLDDRFKGLGYKVMDCYGIKNKVWIDAQRRWVIFDFEYYKSQPISCLFFAFLSKHWEIKMRFQAFLDSHPTFEVLPLVKAIHQHFLKMYGFLEKDSLETRDGKSSLVSFEVLKSQLAHVNQDKIRFILKDLRLIEENDFLRTLFAMKAQVHRLCMAESLDLIGLVESISKQDLIEKPTTSILELVGLSKYIQPLLRFVLQMNLEAD